MTSEGFSGGDRSGENSDAASFCDQTEVIAAIAAALENPPIGLVLLDILIQTDEVGGPVGHDLLWQTLHGRVRKETGPDDAVLKTGTQRLTIIKSGLRAPAEAEGFALRVLAGLRSPMLVGEGRVTCQTAIGVAVSRAGDRAAPLVRYAQHALDDARMLGGDRVVAFDDQDRDLIIQ